MPTVILAPAVARWLTPEPGACVREVRVAVRGETVRQLLDDAFRQYPVIRDYIVDERGTLRHHVVAYLDRVPVTDKATLADTVRADSELYVFQALSGG
jgi:sulfur-carrier protein